MDKQIIIEYNKAIAYFMGWRIDNTFPDRGRVWRNGNAIEMDSTLKYSSDWNWLMEVYNYINAMKSYSVEIHGLACRIYKDDEVLFSDCANTTLEATYMVLAEFSKWHNTKDLQTN